MRNRQDSQVLDMREPPLEPVRLMAVAGLGVAMIGYAWFAAPTPFASIVILAAGVTICLVTVMSLLAQQIRANKRRGLRQLLDRFIERDATPSFITDSDGEVRACNAAANARIASEPGKSLGGLLRDVFANPSAVLFRLQQRAETEGAALEDIITRKGHIRLSVHQLAPQIYLWRLQDMPDKPSTGRNANALPVPMVTVGRGGTILFMNEACRALVGQRVKALDRLFVELPVQPGVVNMVSTTSGQEPVQVLEHEVVAGRRELYLMPLTADAASARGDVFERLPVPMMKIAPDGKILMANRLAKTLIGDGGLTEMAMGDVMQGLGRPMADWLRDVAERKAGHSSEFLRLSRADKEVFVQVTLSRVTEDGHPVLIAVLNDATELKTLEAQFVQSQKMQAIGQLAGGVAHDFNNLLTAISGHCDLLLLRHDQGDPDYGDLIQINQNANRAAGLVGQLLAFSRKQTLRPEILDLRDTLSDLTHLLNRLVGEKVTLTLSHDPVLRPIRADKRQLEQVLMNLVVNARDAMPSGGEIRIETEVVNFQDELKRDRATVPRGEYVCVRVQDEGSGIPADKLQKVFEPFYTTKRTGEGTGLGLSTVYGIIKQSGGYIFVDSAPGQGACFTLYFPVHAALEQSAAPKPIQVAPALPKHGEGVVLLVEDEAPVRAFASRALRLRGYTVLEADSAEDALRTLEDPDLNVDVFVTDVVMPGMDGPSWVREALKTRPEVRVVFVSGYAEGSFGDDGPRVPNSVFLPKPFSLNQLTDTVHQQLN